MKARARALLHRPAAYLDAPPALTFDAGGHGVRPARERACVRELADFLRSRRERLTPAAAGLPSGRRRRTPGLRREELAELAGIGTAWYTWLEQARSAHRRVR